MNTADIVGNQTKILFESISGRELIQVSEMWTEIIMEDAYDLAEVRNDNPSFKVIWDIGGNVGIFSKVAAALWPDAEIHAWEPNPALFEHFERNAPMAKLHRAAAGVFPGKSNLLMDDHVGNSCMEWCFGDANVTQKHNRMEVDCERPWDTAPAPCLVKMDCEGSEHRLLPCMPVRPEVIVVEMHGPLARDSVQRAGAYRPEYAWEEKEWHNHYLRVLLGRLKS